MMETDVQPEDSAPILNALCNDGAFAAMRQLANYLRLLQVEARTGLLSCPHVELARLLN